MEKIDRIEQVVDITAVGIDIPRALKKFQIKEADYTLTAASDFVGVLKTNPGKTLNNGFNSGAVPGEAEEINKQIIEGLNLKLLEQKTIEYCLDVRVPWKLKNNKNIINTFLKTMYELRYRETKLNARLHAEVNIEDLKFSGVKGYKSNRSIKIYSKFDEKGIEEEGDYIRFELILNSKVLQQNKITKISDTRQAKKEFRTFLQTWKRKIETVNRHTTKTIELIELLEKELTKEERD